MKNQRMRICPVCHKGFQTPESEYAINHRTVCSKLCHDKWLEIKNTSGKAATDRLLEEAKKLEREPRKNCVIYDRERNDCIGLTGLWCTVEDCKFYKPKC